MSRHRLINGKLDELPINWEWVPLGDILSNIIGGGTPSKNNPSYWQGRIPWLTIKDMRSRRPIDSMDHISEAAVKESATNIIPADTVIIATRVGLGKVIRVPYDATINQDLKALIPKEGIDKSYLEYWIVSIASYLESIGSGTTVKGVRLETLREIPFPFAPPNQQTRIVAEIEKQFSRLDEAVANLKRVKANLKRYKAAVLKAAVEGKLTEEWRLSHVGAGLKPAPTEPIETGAELLQRILAEWRKAAGKGKYKEPGAPDTNGLPELPEGWVWAALGQLMDEPNYGTSKKCDYDSGSTGVLRIPNIASGLIDASDLKSANFDEKEKRAYSLKAGDLLTIRSNGSVSLVGKCALVRENDTKFLYAGYLIRLRPSNVFILSEYLMTCFSSQLLRRQIEAKAKSTSGVNNINSGELQSLVVPLCCNAEQHQIVAEVERRLSNVTGAETQVDANLRRADRLRQSILKQAFSGQLNPQDGSGAMP